MRVGVWQVQGQTGAGHRSEFAAASEESKRYFDHDDEEFRGGAVRAVLWLLPFVVVAIATSFVVNYEGTAIGLAALIPALLILMIAGHTLVERHVTIAAVTVVVAGLAMLAVAVWVVPFSLFVTLFSLIVLIAVATLGPRAGFGTAVVVIGVIAAERLGPNPTISWSEALATIALSMGSAIVGWVMTRPLRVALDWSWQYYARAQAITDELRVRQGELNRTVKSLNEAYLQLQELNDELARARRAADEARRLKSEFAANISHELRTPLNLIIGFSDMMTSSPRAYNGERLPAAYRRDLDAIQRNALHLSELIDDVLDLSQVEASRMGLVKEQLSLATVVEEAANAVSRLIVGNGLTLTIQLPEDLPAVYADRTRIRQVLINLMSNAARFTDEGGVTISAAVDGGDVRVSVADTGIGIATEDLSKVFEEFRQLDGSIRRRVGGSGLGLAVSKQFVELHGGSIWVESQVGTGTVFHFTVPFRDNVVAMASPGHWLAWDQRMASYSAPSPEVKVSSPDPGAARIFQRYLDGYRVTGYPRLQDVPLATAPDEDAQSACVVVAASVQDGWQQVAAWENGRPGTPVVICALPTKHDLARELGVAAYLVKPISRERVVEVLARLAGPRQNVLIVDDDPDMLRLLGRMVRTAKGGRQVWLAGGGAEAIAILRSRRPDVVLLDLLMPEVDGYAVLREIQSDARLRDVPVVVITARGDEDEAVTVGMIGITRRGGLSINDLMRCVQASLDVLLRSHDTDDRARATDSSVQLV